MKASPANELRLRSRQQTRRVNLRRLRRLIECLLRDLLALEHFELGIFLVAAPEMTRLNERFLRHAGSTDVVTFNHADTFAGFSGMGPGRAGLPELIANASSHPIRVARQPSRADSRGSITGEPAAARTARRRLAVAGSGPRLAAKEIFGEIYVCVDEAVIQARRFRTSWPSELARYVVHGVLHLLGYDDVTAFERRRMKREENRLLKALHDCRMVSELERAGVRETTNRDK